MRKDIGWIMVRLAKYANDKAVVESQDPFKVLISTLLSQRTRDANTSKATERLFSRYKTPKEMEKLPQKELEKLIKGAGFFRAKAKRIKEISKELLEKHDGFVPADRQALLALPGIGPKTSACVMVYAFGKPAICVDTHVHRISNRLGLVDTNTPEETEKALEKALPKRYWLKLNHSMVRFGQKVCRPRNPLHGQCPLRKQCDFYNELGKQGKR